MSDKLPVRTGIPTGDANERQMLEKTGRLGNDSFVTAIRDINGGGTVMLRTRGGNPEFSTTMPEQESEDHEFCPKIDTGLVDTYFNAVDNYPPTYDGESPVETVVDRAGLEITPTQLKNSSSVQNKLFQGMASLYSGMMRRIVQCENGKKDAGEFLFSPAWGKTHGLWVTDAGDRWLIEIDGSDVYRVSLKFCKKLKVGWKDDEQSWLNTLPNEKFIKKVASYWTLKNVGFESKVKIGTLPDTIKGSPFYSLCGWAFNYKGDRATVVLAYSEGEDAPLQTAQWELTFSGDGKQPTAVSWQKLAHDYFVNRNMRDDDFNQAAGGNNGSLQAADDLPGKCATFSFWHPDSIGPRDLDAPVFSYYLETGELHTLMFRSPYKPNKETDEGAAIENYIGPVLAYGGTIEWGGAYQVPMHYQTLRPYPTGNIGGATLQKLGKREVKDENYYSVGWFYSTLVGPAEQWEYGTTMTEECKEVGEEGSYEDDINDFGHTASRTFHLTAIPKSGPTTYWWITFIYARIWQTAYYKTIDYVTTNTSYDNVIYPFAVLHGWDRESYAAGHSARKHKTEKTTTVGNYGTYRYIKDSVAEQLGYSNTVYHEGGGRDIYTIVGCYDVPRYYYPHTIGSPEEDKVVSTDEKEETNITITSILVLGSDTYRLKTSGFGKYGRSKGEWLYYRAARSAFPTRDGESQFIRADDINHLSPIHTSCGDYVCDGPSNSFVGVI